MGLFARISCGELRTLGWDERHIITLRLCLVSLVKELTKTLHRWKLRCQPSLSSSAGPRGRPYNLSLH